MGVRQMKPLDHVPPRSMTQPLSPRQDYAAPNGVAPNIVSSRIRLRSDKGSINNCHRATTWQTKAMGLIRSDAVGRSSAIGVEIHAPALVRSSHLQYNHRDRTDYLPALADCQHRTCRTWAGAPVLTTVTSSQALPCASHVAQLRNTSRSTLSIIPRFV